MSTSPPLLNIAFTNDPFLSHSRTTILRPTTKPGLRVIFDPKRRFSSNDSTGTGNLRSSTAKTSQISSTLFNSSPLSDSSSYSPYTENKIAPSSALFTERKKCEEELAQKYLLKALSLHDRRDLNEVEKIALEGMGISYFSPKIKAELAYLLSRVLNETGRYSEAILYAANGLQEHFDSKPLSEALCHEQALAYNLLGKGSAAKRIIKEEIHEWNSKDPLAMSIKMKFLAQLSFACNLEKNYADASKYAEEALCVLKSISVEKEELHHPLTIFFHYQIVYALIGQNRPIAAEWHALKQIFTAPKHLVSQIEALDLLRIEAKIEQLDKKNPSKCLFYSYRSFLKDFRKFDWLKRLLDQVDLKNNSSICPLISRLYYRLTQMCNQTRLFDFAELAAKKGIAAFSTLTQMTENYLLFLKLTEQLACSYIAQGKYNEAETTSRVITTVEYNKIIRGTNQNVVIAKLYSQYIYALCCQREFVKAHAQCVEARKKVSDLHQHELAEICFFLGVSLSKFGKFGMVIESSLQGLVYLHNNLDLKAWLNYLISEAFYKTREWKKAEIYAKEGISLFSNDRKAIAWLHYLLSQAQYQQEQYENARKSAEFALKTGLYEKKAINSAKKIIRACRVEELPPSIATTSFSPHRFNANNRQANSTIKQSGRNSV